MAGLLLWAAVHLSPSVAPGFKAAWKGKLGEGGYKGSFALLILTGLGLIILGWRSAQPTLIYLPPDILRLPALMLMVLAFLLFTASNRPTRIRRMVRHPQLGGVLVWSVAHLMLNGDSRSLLLFGGLGAWAMVEIVTISRREGLWVKPDAPGWGPEIIGAVIGLVFFAVVLWAHPWLAGVPVF